MAAIDKKQFAQECLDQANTFGTLAQYMLAVAELRSGIDDAVRESAGQEKQYGPFSITLTQWRRFSADPALDLTDDDIKVWGAQCVFFAFWTRASQEAFLGSGENPTTGQLYTKQFPGADASGLPAALVAAAAIMPG